MSVLFAIQTPVEASLRRTTSPDRHGSWLNVAEVELAVMERQSIGGRVPDAIALTARAKSWQQDRNAAKVKVNWHFTTADARIKLRRLYPQIQT